MPIACNVLPLIYELPKGLQIMRNKTWKAKHIEEMVDKFCSIFEYALISLLMKNKILKNEIILF